MSHVAAQETKAGQPLFADLACLLKAAELKGFKKVDTNEYTWWGNHVGDYPIPKGMKKEELGKNALFILRLQEEFHAQAKKKHSKNPYDIGILADPNNEGCYTLIYDFIGGGYGIDDRLGAPVRDSATGGIKLLCPELKQTYDMVCDAAAAKEVGDSIQFFTKKDAHVKYPSIFEESTDEKTWVSITDTSARVGVS